MPFELEPSRSMVARDGTEIAYRRVPGRGEGRVALVHSLAMTGGFWSRVAPLLGEHADVLVYDCRGHGRSDKPPGPYAVETFAEDLADLLDHVGWRSAVVGGASMGGCVSLAFAERFGDRVDGLGLFDTTAWYGEDAPKAWGERARKAEVEGLDALVGFQTTRWFSDAFRAANPSIVEDSVAVFLNNDVAAYAQACRMLGRVDLRAALPGIAAPCRVLVGEEDHATPVAMAADLARGIDGAALGVVGGARHLTPLEVPQEIAAALVALLDDASAGRH